MGELSDGSIKFKAKLFELFIITNPFSHKEPYCFPREFRKIPEKD